MGSKSCHKSGVANVVAAGQAVAYFRWVNAALAEATKPYLLVNMDEASLTYHIAGIVGTVLRRRPRVMWQGGDRASLADRRGSVTYLASICNDVNVNRILPQVLLGNTRRFLQRIMAEASATVGENVYIWREKSAWNNKVVMQRYIRLLCSCLGDCLQSHAVFLLVDMAPCHIHPSVFSLARTMGLRMLLVPTGLTGLLQPLDTHVFRQFRGRMRELWVEHKSVVENGQVSFLSWLRIVSDAIQGVVVSKDWLRAFRQTGLLSCQDQLTPKLLRALGWDTRPVIASGLPGLGQAAALFPRNSTANVEAWVFWRSPGKYVPIRTLD